VVPEDVEEDIRGSSLYTAEARCQIQMSDKARQYNHERLAEHNFDLPTLIQANQGTTLDYGPKFRQILQLEPLLGAHPNFEAIKSYIKGGMPYVFKEVLSKYTRQLEIEATLERGNHKSASKELERLLKLITKDAKRGFSLPISTSTARKLKGAAAQPLGLVHQRILNPDGLRVEMSSRPKTCNSYHWNQSTPSTIKSTWRLLSRDGLWVVPPQDLSLCGHPLVPPPQQANPCLQIRLLKCLPQNGSS
jgi:hypothetical protein